MSEYKTVCNTCTQGQGQGQIGERGCPLRMSDGRSFGDKIYSSRCEAQHEVSDKGFKDTYEYRLFMIANAEALMKQNAVNASRIFFSN